MTTLDNHRKNSMSMQHELKTDPEVFQAALDGIKNYELRFNDREYKVGDTVWLKETTYSGAEMKTGKPLSFTQRSLKKRINHILSGYGLQEGWAVLSFVDVVEDVGSTYKWRTIEGQQHDTGWVTKAGGYFASTASPESARKIAEAMNQTLVPTKNPRNVELMQLLIKIRNSYLHASDDHGSMIDVDPDAEVHYFNDICDVLNRCEDVDTHDTTYGGPPTTIHEYRVALRKWEDNAKYLLDSSPIKTRVRYKNGSESLLDSLIATFIELRDIHK